MIPPMLPNRETPYHSLIYLRYHVHNYGIGSFILVAGIREKPYFPVIHPNPFKQSVEHLSDEFRRYLRHKVEKRPSNLENQVEIGIGFVHEYLKSLEEEGYTSEKPNNKSKLGEELIYIMESKQITSKNFGGRHKENLKDQTNSFLEQLGKASIDTILPQAMHYKPNDSQLQYEYIINYLPRFMIH